MMKLVNFEITQDFGNYIKSPTLVARARFIGPFGDLTVRLSEPLLAQILSLISDEAALIAKTNAQEVFTACAEAADSMLALTHEAAEVTE